MRGKLGCIIISMVTIAVMASHAAAECPDGKQAVQITTPSGITKTLCIPLKAVQGIETAAENSGGTIVTAECPCWTSEDVNDLAGFYSEFFCRDLGNAIRCDYDPSYINTSYYALALKIAGDYYSYSVCINADSGVIEEYISQEEVDACKTLIESYITETQLPPTK